MVQFPQDLRLERGLSTFDQRHHLTVGYMLSSPVGIHGLWRNGGWKTKAFTGWTLSGNFTATSGTPMTAKVSGNLSNTGGTAAFGAGRARSHGRRHQRRQLPLLQLKRLYHAAGGPIWQRRTGHHSRPVPDRSERFAQPRVSIRQQPAPVQLRLAANNALNHVVVTNIGTTFNASNYGLPTAASGTRNVTLTLRFNF